MYLVYVCHVLGISYVRAMERHQELYSTAKVFTLSFLYEDKKLDT